MKHCIIFGIDDGFVDFAHDFDTHVNILRKVGEEIPDRRHEYSPTVTNAVLRLVREEKIQLALEAMNVADDASRREGFLSAVRLMSTIAPRMIESRFYEHFDHIVEQMNAIEKLALEIDEDYKDERLADLGGIAYDLRMRLRKFSEAREES